MGHQRPRGGRCSEVTVKLKDTRQGQVLGIANYHVAVLKIAKDLPTVNIGRSEKHGRMGGAIGHPSGLRTPSLRASSRPSRVPCPTKAMCPSCKPSINPGNSGGTLFNLAGVIGINSQIYSRRGARLVVCHPDRCGHEGRRPVAGPRQSESRPLGWAIQELSPIWRSPSPSPTGALVNSVDKGSVPQGRLAGRRCDFEIQRHRHQPVSELPPLVLTPRLARRP